MPVKGWLLPVLLAPLPASAHPLVSGFEAQFTTLLGALLLGSAWGLYALGARRQSPPAMHAACFHGALAIAAFAVFGPIDDWAQTSVSAHMLQHMLFMVVIAPLVALASPLAQWQAATGRVLRRLWPMLRRWTRAPLPLALLHGAVIWIWHTPQLYRLALDDPGWHVVEHAAFLLSGVLFWWSALHAGPRQRAEALLAMLLTLMHTGLLGALLAFGRVSFYGAERGLADQQLAGLIMWVPGGIAYLAGAGAIAWRWLGRAPATRIAAPGD